MRVSNDLRRKSLPHSQIALDKRGRKIRRAHLDPPVDHFECEESAGFDLMRIPMKWSVVTPSIDLNKLVARLRRSWDSCQLDHVRCGSDFLFQLARRGNRVRLAGVNVTGCARIPATRKSILAVGPLLQQEFAPAIQEQDVHRTVKQVISVNRCPITRYNRFIILVNYR